MKLFQFRQDLTNRKATSYSMIGGIAEKQVGSKGEIFPPKEIREKLGLRPGVKINLKVEDSKLIVRPIPRVNDLLKEPAQVEVTLQEFHTFRRELSKKAESL